MFAGKTHVLPRLYNFDAAHQFFTRQSKPRSSKWDDNERPLKDTRSYHYRIERPYDSNDANAPYYDLILYSQIMARFHRPEADGSERRQYLGHDAQTSKGFMWNVLGVSRLNHKNDDAGHSVVVPIYGKAMPGSKFSLDAVFKGGQLVRERSAHTPHYKQVSDVDDRARRVQVKQLFEPLMTLAIMSMPQFVQKFESTSAGSLWGMSGAFRQADYAASTATNLRHLYAALRTGMQPDETDVAAFMALAEAIFVKRCADTADAKGLLPSPYSFTPASAAQPMSYDTLDPIAPESFAKSLWAKVSDMLCLGSRSGYAEYPQFPQPGQFTASNVVVGAR